MTDETTGATQAELQAMTDDELFDFVRRRALSAERYASRAAEGLAEAARRIDLRAQEGRIENDGANALLIKGAEHDFKAAEFAMKGAHARATVAGCDAMGSAMTRAGDR